MVEHPTSFYVQLTAVPQWPPDPEGSARSVRPTPDDVERLMRHDFNPSARVGACEDPFGQGAEGDFHRVTDAPNAPASAVADRLKRLIEQWTSQRGSVPEVTITIWRPDGTILARDDANLSR